MSVEIDLDLLTQDQKNAILNELIIKEKQSFIAAGFGGQAKNHQFYLIKGKKIYLPYNFYLNNINSNLNFERKVSELNPENNVFKGKLREKQEDIVNQALEQLNKFGTTILNLDCSVGKTVMSVYLTTVVGLKTLVLLPFTALVIQWCQEYQEFTNLKCYMVGESNDDKKNPDLMKQKIREADVIICYTSKARIDLIPQDVIDQIGYLILDEAECVCTSERIQMMLNVRPHYIQACTATAFKHNGLEQMLFKLVGEHRVSNTTNNEINKQFKLYRFNTNMVPDGLRYNDNKLDWWSLVDFQVDNDERNKKIFEIIDMNPESKFMILCQKADHPKKLHDLIKIERPEFTCDYLSSKKKKYIDSKILCGTVNKLGTGFDQKNSCQNFDGVRVDVLILTGTFRDERLIHQTCGRSFRSDDPKIYFMCDNFKTCNNHWREIVKWAKSRQCNSIEVI